MKKPVVIGLCGYMRAGKDTVGGILVENGYKRVALADAVKEMALAINPFFAPDPQKPNRLADYVNEVGWELAKENAEVRRLLQNIGTEGVRNVIGDDTWLKVAERKILQGYSYPVGRWVITDIRFPNEAVWVREKLGGEVWKIVRPGRDGGRRDRARRHNPQQLVARRARALHRAGPLPGAVGPRLTYLARLWRCQLQGAFNCSWYVYLEPDADPPRCRGAVARIGKNQPCGAPMVDAGLYELVAEVGTQVGSLSSPDTPVCPDSSHGGGPRPAVSASTGSSPNGI
jgi:hypothetical protein